MGTREVNDLAGFTGRLNTVRVEASGFRVTGFLEPNSSKRNQTGSRSLDSGPPVARLEFIQPDSSLLT